ncbi:MAG: class I SAM-dependent rRNA methyltransferase [Bacteroidales bacterium]|nr:class I SAM-dependent rRNA methyltransferase [Bacteroidales bacterium]
MGKIYLKRGREESLRRYHPWVFSGAVDSIERSVEEGDIAQIYSSEELFLGCGHFQNGSIAVRMLSFDDLAMDSSFWLKRLSDAYKLRVDTAVFGAESTVNQIQAGVTNAYRLVHGEGDMLPGLIIDFYNGTAVIQAHSTGMFLSRVHITEALKSLYGTSLNAVYDKSSSTAPFKAGLELEDGYLYRRDGYTQQTEIILEHGNRFMVDWEGGQKTGFFLDQRENRELLKSYSNGRRVLNLFCYTGGFSVYALAGGALSVDSVDSSAKAMELLEKNIKLNIDSSLLNKDLVHTSYCEDAILFLKNIESGKYDLIVVDPPAFAKHRGALKNALRAYQRLNSAAISAVASGGIIFTYSCSQVVDKLSFAESIFSAAAQCGRSVRIIGRLTQPVDHPVNIFHPEGEYLKGLVLYVD